MADGIIEAFTSVLQPVMETAMVLAGHYVKASGRTCITGQDVTYCLKYCAMTKVGDTVGSLFPEIYEDSSDESDIEELSEDHPDNVFSRYEGDEKVYNDINNAVDDWDIWIPSSPAEELIKGAIDAHE